MPHDLSEIILICWFAAQEILIIIIIIISDWPIPIICKFMYPITDMQNRYLFTFIK